MEPTQKIQAWIEQTGTSQSELARRTGMDRKRLSDILRGVFDLSNWSFIRELSREMGVPSDYLMDPTTDWPPPRSFEGRVLSRDQERILEAADGLRPEWAVGRLKMAPHPDDPIYRALSPERTEVPLGEARGDYAKPLGFSKRPDPGASGSESSKPKRQDHSGTGGRSRT